MNLKKTARFGTSSNYVLFENVEADGGGVISFTGKGMEVADGADDDYRLGLSGFQLVPAVGGASPYDTWAATNAPSPETPETDFDGDGVSNGVEFVLGGLATTNDLYKLPTVATTPGGDMTFTFERDQASIDASTTVTIEVGTDLQTWNTLLSPYAVPDTASVNNPGVTVVKDSPIDFDTVTLTVVQAPYAKLFARLKVVITP